MKVSNPWESKISTAGRSISLERPLPFYAFQFVFRHLDGFRKAMILLSAVSVSSCLLKFGTIAILSYILSNVATLTEQELWKKFVPLLGLCIVAGECLDYVTRRYSEALPQVYSDVALLRLYQALLTGNPSRVANLSGERVITLFERYVLHLQTFFSEWFWGTLPKATQLIIVLGILAYQSPIVFAINAIYIVGFLWLAFVISERFSKVAKVWSRTNIDRAAVIRNFALNLPVVMRLYLQEFFSAVSHERLRYSWRAFSEVRAFHAGRWFLQLNIFNALYLGTLVYGIYQVRAGVHGIGLLLLLKWAYDGLWGILVYMIEYWVTLVQQREDAKLVREAVASVFEDSRPGKDAFETVDRFESLALSSAVVRFDDPRRGDGALVTVAVPSFSLKAGDKVGIVGPSGSGKSTILSMLLHLVPFAGSYRINGKSVENVKLSQRNFSLVSNLDPLFRLSIRENLLLGEQVSEERVRAVLDGVAASEFCTDLDVRIGDATTNLSAGQEQRLRLARGLLRESDVYLLDEPFNSLDPDTRDRVARFVTEWLREKTVIIVSHLATDLEMTERIFRMRNGRLMDESSG